MLSKYGFLPKISCYGTICHANHVVDYKLTFVLDCSMISVGACRLVSPYRTPSLDRGLKSPLQLLMRLASLQWPIL